MTLLFDFIPTMRVCVREPILLQFIADILWILLLVILRLLVMRFLILILMEFLLILVTIILRLLILQSLKVFCIVSGCNLLSFLRLLLHRLVFIVSLLQIIRYFLLLLLILFLLALKILLLNLETGVRVCVRGPPYTTAPPCNAWGNAPRQ